MPGPEPPRLGERLLLARRRLHLTQEELARAAGVSVATVARLEQGQTLRTWTDVLAKLGRALGISTDYLLGLEEREDFAQRKRPRWVLEGETGLAASLAP